MILYGRVINYKVDFIDLDGIYNFYIKFIFIQCRLKCFEFCKVVKVFKYFNKNVKVKKNPICGRRFPSTPLSIIRRSC